MTLSKQLREAERQITGFENDVQALKALNAMNMAEHERLLGKLLLLTAQVALEAHGEFSLASKISDFLTTPFASTEGEQVSCGHGAQREAATGFFRLFHASSETPAGIQFASTPDEAQGHTSRVVAGENGAGQPHAVSPEIFPRVSPSDAGGPGLEESRPLSWTEAHVRVFGLNRPDKGSAQIHLCNKERRPIVRSAEERGK